MLPQCYPNCKTVHRRLQRWCEQEVLRDVLCALTNAWPEQGGLDERECLVNPMFTASVEAPPGAENARGGRLRHAQRRWIVGAIFSCIQWHRRIIVRWECYVCNVLVVVQLAGALILLKQS